MEIADPVRHTEVAKIGNWHDVVLLQVAEAQVRKLPIETIWSDIRSMKRHAVPQVAEAEVSDEFEVCASMGTVATFLHFVDAGSSAIDCGVAIFDAGSEHEIWIDHRCRRGRAQGSCRQAWRQKL